MCPNRALIGISTNLGRLPIGSEGFGRLQVIKGVFLKRGGVKAEALYCSKRLLERKFLTEKLFKIKDSFTVGKDSTVITPSLYCCGNLWLIAMPR